MPIGYPFGWKETFMEIFERDYLPDIKKRFGFESIELYLEEHNPAEIGGGHHTTLQGHIYVSKDEFGDDDYLTDDGAKTRMGGFRLVSMPGCCGIAISTGSWVHHEFRSRGIGTILNKARLDLAKILEFGAVICTDVSHNAPSRKLLEKNGWKDVFKFKNPRTRNEVFLSVIPLERN